MLEKFIASLLVPYLSKYVENIDEGQLRIDLWSGKASLQDLVLKASVLDELLDPVDAQGKRKAGAPRLPLHIHRGLCKRVSLHIPLKHLRSQPIVLEVDELLLTLRGGVNNNSSSSNNNSVTVDDGNDVRSKAERWEAVRVQNEVALDAFERARQEQKQQQQQQTSSNNNDNSDESADDAAVTKLRTKGYFARLGELILHNIVVKVHTVHVRYEDEPHDTIVGAILADVQLLTVDERTGEAGFTDATRLPCMHKRLVFSGVQVYCEDARRVQALRARAQCWCTRMDSWQAWYHAMRQRVRDGDVALSTLFGPAAGRVDAHVVFDAYRASMPHTPCARVAVTLEHMLARLTRSQFVTLARAAARLTSWRVAAALPVRRPTVPVRGNARVWWRYALHVVRHLCAAPRHAQLRERFSRASMPSYMQLYHAKLRARSGGDWTAAQDKAYRFLVRYMTLASLIAARKALYAHFAVELSRLQTGPASSSPPPSLAATAARQPQRQPPHEQAVETLHSGERDTNASRTAAVATRRRGGGGGWWAWLRKSSDATATATTTTATEVRADEANEMALLQQLAREYGVDDMDAPLAVNSNDNNDDTTHDGSDVAHTTATGDAATSAEQRAHSAAAAASTTSASLPASYRWLSLVVRVPWVSGRLELSTRSQLTLHTHALYAAVDTFNAAHSLQFVVRVQRLTLSNPLLSSSSSRAASHELVANLIEPIDATSDKSDHDGDADDDDTRRTSTPPTTTTAAAAARVQSFLVTDGDGDTHAHAHARGDDTTTPLLYVCGALHPVAQPLPDTHVDVALHAHVLPLRVLLDVALVQQLVAWCTLPPDVTQSSLTTRTRRAATRVTHGSATQQLRDAMTHAHGLCIAVDVHAPVLLLPRTLQPQQQQQQQPQPLRRHTSTLAVSFGRLWCDAQPLSASEKRRRLARGRADEAALYYTHTAALQSLYVELTTLEAAVRRPARGFLLLSKVAVTAAVRQRIAADDDGHNDNNNNNSKAATVDDTDGHDNADTVAPPDERVAHERVIVRLQVPQLQLTCSHAVVQLLTRMAQTWTTAMTQAAAATATTTNMHTDVTTTTTAAAALAQREGYVRTTNFAALVANNDDNNNGNEDNDAAYACDAMAAAVATTTALSRSTSSGGDVVAVRDAAVSPPPAARHDATPHTRLHVHVEHFSVHLLDDSDALSPSLPQRDCALDDHAAMAAVLRLRRHRTRLVRYAISVLDIDAAVAMASRQTAVSVQLKTLSLVDTTQTCAPVLSGVGCRADVLLPSSPPATTTMTTTTTTTTTTTATEVSVTLHGGSAVRIGSPLLNVVEAVVRLRDAVARVVASADDGSSSHRSKDKDDASTRTDDRAAAAVATTRSASRPLRVEARVDGTVTVIFLDNVAAHGHRRVDTATTRRGHVDKHRSALADEAAATTTSLARHAMHARAQRDVEVLFIALDNAAVSLQQQQQQVQQVQQQQAPRDATATVTLLRASVASVTVRAGEATRLATPHRMLLRRTAQRDDDTSASPQLSVVLRQDSASARPRFCRRRDGDDDDDSGNDDNATASSAAAPRLHDRVLVNGAALRYDSWLQLQLTATTAVVDVYTMQRLQDYFAHGLFARLTHIASGNVDDNNSDNDNDNSSGIDKTSDDTNRNDEGRALFGLQVSVTQSTLLLPTHPRSETATPTCVALALQRVLVHKSLHVDAAEEHVAVDVRVQSLQRTTTTTTRPRRRPVPHAATGGTNNNNNDHHNKHSTGVVALPLLASPWSLRVHVRLPLDEHNVRAMRYVDVRSDGLDVALRVSSDDVIAFAALAHNHMSGDATASTTRRRRTHHRRPYDDNDKHTTTSDDADAALCRATSLPAYATAPATSRIGDDDEDDDNAAIVARSHSAQLGTDTPAHDNDSDNDSDDNGDNDNNKSTSTPPSPTTVTVAVAQLRVDFYHSPTATAAVMAAAPTNVASGASSVSQFALSLHDVSVLMVQQPAAAAAAAVVSTTGNNDDDNMDVRVRWQRIELLDTRDDTTSVLAQVTDGDVRLAPTRRSGAALLRRLGAVQPQHVSSHDRHHTNDDKDDVAALAMTNDAALLLQQQQQQQQQSVLHDADDNNDGDGDAAPTRTDNDDDDSVVAPTTQLFVSFVLRRLAVSDQWLSVHDFVYNEALIHALGVRTTTTATKSKPAEHDDDDNNKKKMMHMHCVLHTSDVVVPLLDTSRRTLCELRVSSLAVDVVVLQQTRTYAAVHVRDVRVVDAVSGVAIVHKRATPLPSTVTDTYNNSNNGNAATTHMVNVTATSSSPTPPPSLLPVACTGRDDSSSSSNDDGGSASARLSTPPATTTTATSPAVSSDLAQQRGVWRDRDVLHVLVRSDTVARAHHLRISLGELDVLCAMPLLYGLVDYATAADQPVAKISQLGGMREQRARVRQYAKRLAARSNLSLHLLWQQPRIVLVGDALPLLPSSTSSRRAHDVHVMLGAMRAHVRADTQLRRVVARVRVSDVSVAGLVDRATLQLRYNVDTTTSSSQQQQQQQQQHEKAQPQQHKATSQRTDDDEHDEHDDDDDDTRVRREIVRAQLGQCIGRLRPQQVERVLYMLKHNLLLPPHTPYYHLRHGTRRVRRGDGDDDTATEATTTTTTTTTAAEATTKATAATQRVVHARVDGVFMQVYDVAGAHTHTAQLSRVRLHMRADGTLRVVVPAIDVHEYFTHQSLLHSGRRRCVRAFARVMDEHHTSAPQQQQPPQQTAATTRSQAAYMDSLSSSGDDDKSDNSDGDDDRSVASDNDNDAHDTTRERDAVDVLVDTAAHTTLVRLSHIAVVVVPRGIGSLVNTLLSIRVPADVHVDSPDSEAADNDDNDNNDNKNDNTTTTASATSQPRTASARRERDDTSRATAAASVAPASQTPQQTTTLSSSSLRDARRVTQTVTVLLAGCRLRCLRGARDVARAHVSRTRCRVMTHADGSTTLRLVVGALTVRDTLSRHTHYPYILTTHVDDDDDARRGEAGNDAATTGEAHAGDDKQDDDNDKERHHSGDDDSAHTTTTTTAAAGARASRADARASSPPPRRLLYLHLWTATPPPVATTTATTTAATTVTTRVAAATAASASVTPSPTAMLLSPLSTPSPSHMALQPPQPQQLSSQMITSRTDDVLVDAQTCHDAAIAQPCNVLVDNNNDDNVDDAARLYWTHSGTLVIASDDDDGDNDAADAAAAAAVRDTTTNAAALLPPPPSASSSTWPRNAHASSAATTSRQQTRTLRYDRRVHCRVSHVHVVVVPNVVRALLQAMDELRVYVSAGNQYKAYAYMSDQAHATMQRERAQLTALDVVVRSPHIVLVDTPTPRHGGIVLYPGKLTLRTLLVRDDDDDDSSNDEEAQQQQQRHDEQPSPATRGSGSKRGHHDDDAAVAVPLSRRDVDADVRAALRLLPPTATRRAGDTRTAAAAANDDGGVVADGAVREVVQVRVDALNVRLLGGRAFRTKASVHVLYRRTLPAELWQQQQQQQQQQQLSYDSAHGGGGDVSATATRAEASVACSYYCAHDAAFLASASPHYHDDNNKNKQHNVNDAVAGSDTSLVADMTPLTADAVTDVAIVVNAARVRISRAQLHYVLDVAGALLHGSAPPSHMDPHAAVGGGGGKGHNSKTSSSENTHEKHDENDEDNDASGDEARAAAGAADAAGITAEAFALRARDTATTTTAHAAATATATTAAGSDQAEATAASLSTTLAAARARAEAHAVAQRRAALVAAQTNNNDDSNSNNSNNRRLAATASRVVQRVAVAVDAAEVELAELFRLTCHGARVRRVSDGVRGAYMAAALDEVCVQHISTFIYEPDSVANVNALTTATIAAARASIDKAAGNAAALQQPHLQRTLQQAAATAATTPERRSNKTKKLTSSSSSVLPPQRRRRATELIDMLLVTHAQLRLHTLPEEMDEAYLASTTEQKLRCTVACVRLSLSPTILFDTREVLYLPVCNKLLRTPVDPQCVLDLSEAVTQLAHDLVLDDKHIMLTTNRTRCNFVLDLNTHRLILSGAPSAQLVLADGCEVVMTNGTLVVPGMYTIDSFVSFGAGATLHTTPSCVVEKRYLNVYDMRTRADAARALREQPQQPLRQPQEQPTAATAANAQANAAVDASSPTAMAAAATAVASRRDLVVPSAAFTRGGVAPDLLGGAGMLRVRDHDAAADDDNDARRAGQDGDNNNAAADASMAPSHSATQHADGAVLVERSVRLLIDVVCDDLELRTLSDELVDLSTSVRAHVHGKVMLVRDNDTLARRSIDVDVAGMHSGVGEEHVLLPTNVRLHVAGVDNVSTTLTLDALQLTTRVALLRSSVELAKDFVAAFVEEKTVTRHTPTARFESRTFLPLYPVARAGVCRHCGRGGAHLSKQADGVGVLCCRCCTGRDHLAAAELLLEVALVDCVLLSSQGDFAHVYMRNTSISLDPYMQLEARVKASVYNLSNAAAVWEPLLESVDVAVSGNVHHHAYRVRVDHCDVVVTPMHLRVVTLFAGDYGDTTTLQHRLRGRFRALARRRAVRALSPTPRYVREATPHERALLRLQRRRRAATVRAQVALAAREAAALLRRQQRFTTAKGQPPAASRQQHPQLPLQQQEQQQQQEDDKRRQAGKGQPQHEQQQHEQGRGDTNNDNDDDEPWVSANFTAAMIEDYDGSDDEDDDDGGDDDNDKSDDKSDDDDGDDGDAATRALTGKRGAHDDSSSSSSNEAEYQGDDKDKHSDNDDDEKSDNEKDSDNDEHHNSDDDDEDATTTSRSLFERLAALPRGGRPPPRSGHGHGAYAWPYATVNVINFCNRALLVDGHVVPPRQGRLTFTTPRREIAVRRQTPLDDADVGCVVSLAASPVYVRARGLLLRNSVTVERDGHTRHLRRTTQLRALPLHTSNTVLRVHNRLRCALAIDAGASTLAPGDRYYLAADADLTQPLRVQPIVRHRMADDDGVARSGHAHNDDCCYKHNMTCRRCADDDGHGHYSQQQQQQQPLVYNPLDGSVVLLDGVPVRLRESACACYCGAAVAHNNDHHHHNNHNDNESSRDGDVYEPGQMSNGRVPRIDEVLYGVPTPLVCRSRVDARRRLRVVVTVRQEDMRGGVPLYVISIEARYTLENKLPYAVRVRATPCLTRTTWSASQPKRTHHRTLSGGDREFDGKPRCKSDGSDGAASSPPASPPASPTPATAVTCAATATTSDACDEFVPLARDGVVVEPMMSMPLHLGMLALHEFLFTIEVHQPVDGSRRRSRSSDDDKKKNDDDDDDDDDAAAASECYVSEPVVLCDSDLIALRSCAGRQMLVRAKVSCFAVLLCTPFALVNHTMLKLHISESNAAGEERLPPCTLTNFTLLPPFMRAAVAASPHDGDQKRFFVNVHAEDAVARGVPLHVQQRGLILLEEEKGSAQASSPQARARDAQVPPSAYARQFASALSATRRSGRDARAPARGRTVHLAYITRIDASGALLVTITPRWVVVNRTPWTLYVAAARYAVVNALEAAAAAAAERQAASAPSNSNNSGDGDDANAQQGDDNDNDAAAEVARRKKSHKLKWRNARGGDDDGDDDDDGGGGAAAMLRPGEDMQYALESLSEAAELHLTDPLAATAVGAGTAMPFYDTPQLPSRVGFNMHVLLSPYAPLLSNPVHLDTIASETIVAYEPRIRDAAVEASQLRELRAQDATERRRRRRQQHAPSRDNNDDNNNDDNDDSDNNDDKDAYEELDTSAVQRATREREALRQQMMQLTNMHELLRARYLDVVLAAGDPYTFVVVEEAPVMPYVVLNRLAYAVELVNTASKDAGRVLARVAAGFGAELLLDPTVTTRVRVVPVYLDDANACNNNNNNNNSDDNRAGNTHAMPHSRPIPGATAADIDVQRALPPRAADALARRAGLRYRLGNNERGQHVVELLPAAPAHAMDKTVVACPPTPLDVVVNVCTTTVAVVQPNADLLFATITDTRLSWQRRQRHESWRLSVLNFQVDNQTEVAPRYESCVLALRPSHTTAAIACVLERELSAASGKALLKVTQVRVDIKPVALRVTDTLLLEMLRFAMDVSGGAYAEAGKTRVRVPMPSNAVLYCAAPRSADALSTNVELHNFIINPILLRLWLTRDPDGRDFFKESMSGRMAVLLSTMVSSCDDVQVAAPGVVAVERHGRLGVLLQWLLKSYADGLVAQLRALVLQYAASLPLIGAPLRLASGIGNGAVRLFQQPIDGLSTSPAAFAQGLASGTVGFAQSVASGGLGAFANLTDTGSRVLSKSAGVPERERRRHNTLTGLVSGITGLVRRPREGAAEDGARGLLVGTAQGVLGVVANPLSGLLSDVSRGTTHLSRLVADTHIPRTSRLRPLRSFFANGGVAPWRALVSVYQYERYDVDTQRWTSYALLPSTDGPAWYPAKPMDITYGNTCSASGNNPHPHNNNNNNNQRGDGEAHYVPAHWWVLDRYEASYYGWVFSRKYYGFYGASASEKSRVRRRRWAALVRPLPYSPMAAHLRVTPGREAAPGVGLARVLGVSSNNNNNKTSAVATAARVTTTSSPLPPTAATTATTAAVLAHTTRPSSPPCATNRSGVAYAVAEAAYLRTLTCDTIDVVAAAAANNNNTVAVPRPADVFGRDDDAQRQYTGVAFACPGVVSAYTPAASRAQAREQVAQLPVQLQQPSRRLRRQQQQRGDNNNNNGDKDGSSNLGANEQRRNAAFLRGLTHVASDYPDETDVNNNNNGSAAVVSTVPQPGEVRMRQRIDDDGKGSSASRHDDDDDDDDDDNDDDDNDDDDNDDDDDAAKAQQRGAPLLPPLLPDDVTRQGAREDDSRAVPPRPLRFEDVQQPVDAASKKRDKRLHKRDRVAVRTATAAQQADDARAARQRAQPAPYSLQQQRRRVVALDVYEYEARVVADSDDDSDNNNDSSGVVVVRTAADAAPRCVPVASSSQWSKAHLPPGVAAWQDVHGRAVPSPDAMRSPRGWRWVSEWQVVASTTTTTTTTPGAAAAAVAVVDSDDAWQEVEKAGQVALRRRHWQRRLTKNTATEPPAIDSLEL